MKTTFIQIVLTFAILMASLLSSCNSNALINKDDIITDSLTHYCVFKATGEKVTGRIKFNVPHEGGDSMLCKALLKNGLIKEDKYYLAGQLVAECYYEHPHAINVMSKQEEFDENGKLCQLYEYDEKGRLYQNTSYDGEGNLKEIDIYNYEEAFFLVKKYKDGKQVQEIIYDLEGYPKKGYYFDENGDKIIPAIDKLKEIACETGFYRYYDKDEREFRYVPMVILKMKNITQKPLEGKVILKGIFIQNGEELSTNYTFFQKETDNSLRPELARQANIQSNVSWGGISRNKKNEVKCQIYIDENPYRTIEIKNKVLTSNMIQQ